MFILSWHLQFKKNLPEMYFGRDPFCMPCVWNGSISCWCIAKLKRLLSPMGSMGYSSSVCTNLKAEHSYMRVHCGFVLHLHISTTECHCAVLEYPMYFTMKIFIETISSKHVAISQYAVTTCLFRAHCQKSVNWTVSFFLSNNGGKIQKLFS